MSEQGTMIVKFRQARVLESDGDEVVIELCGGSFSDLSDLHSAVDTSDIGKLGKLAIHAAIEECAYDTCVLSHIIPVQ